MTEQVGVGVAMAKQVEGVRKEEDDDRASAGDGRTVERLQSRGKG